MGNKVKRFGFSRKIGSTNSSSDKSSTAAITACLARKDGDANVSFDDVEATTGESIPIVQPEK
jgi:hypothetical protein